MCVSHVERAGCGEEGGRRGTYIYTPTHTHLVATVGCFHDNSLLLLLLQCHKSPRQGQASCVCVCVCVSVCECVYVYVCECVGVGVCVWVWMCVRDWRLSKGTGLITMGVCCCPPSCQGTSLSAHSHTHTHTDRHTHTHTHKH